MRMPEYSVLKEKTKSFGKNGYIEIALKKVVDGNDGREFITITRGYVNQEGARRWVRYVTLPADNMMRSFLVDTVKDFE
ncbi:MAG: hypothetical protein HY556_10095 [Euryarchaeota archaeon]|nr:hypothetical protein [Euryarchaeota archaeon]